MTFSERIQDIAYDLATIEINTIVTNREITSAKIGDPQQTLDALAVSYQDKLEELGEPRERLPGRPGGVQSFSRLRRSAQKRLDELQQKKKPSEEDEHTANALSRIVATSNQMQQLLDTVQKRTQNQKSSQGDDQEVRERSGPGGANLGLEPESKLTLDELMMLRKAWVLGVERIAIQTQVSLSGDLVTRIHEDFAHESHAGLREFHHRSIRVALDCWNDLFHLLKDLARGVFQSLFSWK